MVPRHPVMRVIADELGYPPMFFREGLALSAGPIYDEGYLWVRHDVDLGAQVRGESPVEYEAPAAYTKFLVETYGRDAYMRFYARAPDEAGWDALRHQFAAELGVPLEQTLAAWEALPGGYRGDSYYWLDECEAERVELAPGEPVELAPELDCAHLPLDINHVAGYLGAYRTVELEAGEALHLALSSDVKAGVELMGCDKYVEGEPQVWFPEDARHPTVELWTDPGPGLYFLNVREREAGVASGSATLALSVAAMPVAESCDAAGEVPVKPGTEYVSIDAEVGRGGTAFFWVVPEATTRLRLETASFPFGYGLWTDSATGAQLCTGPCGDLACEGIDYAPVGFSSANPFDLLAGERYLLRVNFEPDSHVTIWLLQ